MAKTITLCIPLVLGCSRGQPHGNQGEITVKRGTNLPTQILRHNEARLSSGDWTLTTWTNGYTYAQGEPIDIGLHLTFSGKGPQPVPEAKVRLKLKQATGPRELNRGLPLHLRMVKDPKVVNRSLTVPFKEVNKNPPEWEAKIADAFNTDSHRPGASILPEGEYLLDGQVKISETVEFIRGGGKSTIENLIYIDNVDSKNRLDYSFDSRQNETSSSSGDWKLITWTDGSRYPSGTAIALRLHLTFSGRGPRPVPKATMRLKLTQVNGPTVLSRELAVPPFKEVKKNPLEWEAVLADAFKTDAKRPGASILPEGTYNITYTLIIDKDIKISGKEFPIKTPGRIRK